MQPDHDQDHEGAARFAMRRSRMRLPLNSLAPNILTVLALCAGLTSIRFSLLERWEQAVTAIFVAAVFDTLDGRVARLLKGASRFGAELDSLSDFLSFGVAPAILIYLWGLEGAGNIGWAAALAYAVCAALRLARFNTALDDPNRAAWSMRFFMGVPAPAAAGLLVMPLLLSFDTGQWRAPAFVLIPWLVAIGALMVSRLPTYSFKKVQIRREFILPVLFIVGLIAILLVTEPWITLFSLGLAYLAALPIGYRDWRRMRRGSDAPPPL